MKGKMWRMVQQVYKKTVSCVVVEDQKTEWKTSDVGVRQGCVMSPNLFSMFINGMAERVKKGTRGIRWAGKELKILLLLLFAGCGADGGEGGGQDRMLSVQTITAKSGGFSPTRRSAR